MTILTEDRAREILSKNMHTSKMIRHSISVAAAMREIARHFGEDEEFWGAVGLIHDVDYEYAPSEHCSNVRMFLEPEGMDDELIHTIETHGYDTFPNAPAQETLLERCLCAVDRFSWIAVAAARNRKDKGAAMTEADIFALMNDREFDKRFNCSHVIADCSRVGISLELAAKCAAAGVRARYDEISKAIL